MWKLISSFKMPDLSTQIFKARPQHKIIYSAVKITLFLIVLVDKFWHEISKINQWNFSLHTSYATLDISQRNTVQVMPTVRTHEQITLINHTSDIHCSISFRPNVKGKLLKRCLVFPPDPNLWTVCLHVSNKCLLCPKLVYCFI